MAPNTADETLARVGVEAAAAKWCTRCCNAVQKRADTCGGDKHHGNLAILDQVSNVGPAFLDLEHNFTVDAVSLQVLAGAPSTHDAKAQLLQRQHTAQPG